VGEAVGDGVGEVEVGLADGNGVGDRVGLGVGVGVGDDDGVPARETVDPLNTNFGVTGGAPLKVNPI
jgi:hypothetical protein